MKIIKIIFFIFLKLFLISNFINCAYFYVKEGVDKCFVENVAKNVILIIYYDNYNLQDMICAINIKDVNGRVLYSHDTSKIKKGKMSYLSKIDGYHFICISCPSTNWFKTSLTKWSLSIETGGSDIDTKNMATKSDMEKTLNTLEKLNNKFISMKTHQRYQKKIASESYKYNEGIHKNMFYCYITEILLLIIITIYSILHLKNYFKSQRLM